MTTASPPSAFVADPVIPSRDLLLDRETVSEIIGRITHHEGAMEWCSLRRAKYRVGESMRVVYDVIADGREYVMSALTFANSAGDRKSVV